MIYLLRNVFSVLNNLFYLSGKVEMNRYVDAKTNKQTIKKKTKEKNMFYLDIQCLSCSKELCHEIKPISESGTEIGHLIERNM